MPATHPTKEQVRAYMRLRECARRPPPSPQDIRRQLGWQGAPAPEATIAAPTLMFAGTMAHLAGLMAVHWCFIAAGIRYQHHSN